MKFTHEIRIGDLISTCSFLIAAVGLFLNWWQLRIGGIRKRAEFIVSVFNQYISDPDTARMFYDLEYGRFQYDGEFHGSDQERHLDRLLSYFEKIAALYDMGTITLHDLKLVRYDFVRVFHNQAVQQYFQTLDRLAPALKVGGGTFARYRRVARLLDTGNVDRNA
ncbi:MAG: hypothetical protein WAO00_01945 [Chthoniobacterales bacterium]